MKNILITGVAGFIGSNVAKKILGEGKFHVIGVDNFNPYYDEKLKKQNLDMCCRNNFEFVYADITDEKSISDIFDKYKISCVIHLAAQAGVRYSVDHSEIVYKTNIIGFDIVARLACKNGVEHVIYASSSSVNGDDGTQKSPYAVSKATNELQAHMYSNLYPKTKFTGLRFFTVYGDNIRTDLAISKFMKSIEKNETIYIYGDGNQSRDFTYIDDVTEAIKRIVESDKNWKSEVFDVGYGESITVNELVSMLTKIINPSFNKIIKVESNNYDVIKTLSNPNKLKQWFDFKPIYSLYNGLTEMHKKRVLL